MKPNQKLVMTEIYFLEVGGRAREQAQKPAVKKPKTRKEAKFFY